MVSVTQGVDGFFFGNMSRTVFCGGVLVAALLVTPLLLVTFLTGHARDIQRAPFVCRGTEVGWGGGEGCKGCVGVVRGGRGVLGGGSL